MENQSVRNNANIEPHCHDDVRERSKSRSIDKYKMFVFIFSFLDLEYMKNEELPVHWSLWLH